MSERPSVYQLQCDAADIATAISRLEAMGDEADPADMAIVMERLEEYGEEAEDKMSAISYVRDSLESINFRYRSEIRTLQRAIKGNDRAIARVKSLGVDLLRAVADVKGLGEKESVTLELPNGSKAGLVRKPSYLKPIWSKRDEGLLPDEVKRVEVKKVVDKDLLLEWSETAEMPLNESGDPAVLIERVDPTHWAIYGKEK